jgi:hypothetical protein
VFFQEAAGVYTSKTAAQMLAAAAVAADTQFPVFIFGNSDYASAYKNMFGEFPAPANWTFEGLRIWTNQQINSSQSTFDSNVTDNLQKGDLLFVFTRTTGGNDYLTLIRVRCKQVGYASLLDSVNSDKFVLNLIRYKVASANAVDLDQYDNDIKYINQSLFGSKKSDSFSPISNKLPEQQQDNIVDIPIKMGVSKETALGSYLNYDISGEILWTVFVWGVKKA